MPDEPRHCLCCGNRLEYGKGRSDRKFCNRTCKNNYHNRLRGNFKDMKPKVDGIIMKNYAFLDDMVKLGVKSIPMPEAVSAGFNPSYSTSVFQSEGYCEHCCYDIIYRVSAIRIFKIRRLSLTLRELEDL